MKLLSLILSVYILCLSGQQGLAAFVKASKSACAETSSCCKKEQNPVKQSHQACNGTCNPFMICSSSPFITTQQEELQLSFVDLKQEFVTYSNTFSSPSLNDNWHPPEII